MSKILVVVGATGTQGGSVINSILGDPSAKSQFKIRAITRDTSKPNAKSLESQGVEVVSADLGDKESLVKAFGGAYAVFGVTDYWHTMDDKVEIQQGKNLVDSAKEAGVEHFVWSGLGNVSEITKGALPHVYHFDSKAKVTEYIKSVGLPYTEWQPGFYMSNLTGGMIRKDDSSGTYILGLPLPENQLVVPLLDTASDTGKFIKSILLNPKATIGKTIYGSQDYYSAQQILQSFKSAFPKINPTINYVEFPDDGFKGALASQGMPEHGQVEMLENMKLLTKEFGYYGGADLKESVALVKEPLTTLTEFFKNAPQFKDLN